MSVAARVVALAAAVLIAAPSGHGAAAPSGGSGALRPVPGGVERVFQAPVTPYGAGHRGVDLRGRPGTPVRAALGGTVTFAGSVAGRGWITINHGGGLDTTYGWLDPQVVRAGQHVAAGDLLGFLARRASHLDWGSRLDGEYIDPLTLLAGWETYLTTADEPLPFAPLGGDTGVRPAGSLPPGVLQRPAVGAITSGFGPRIHPVTGERRLHAGVDIGAPYGSAIRSAAPGTVTFAGEVSGYGLTVIVEHSAVHTTLYAHQSRIAVGAGQPVAAGATLGYVGATGTATGPHLHFEVRIQGAAQDPLPWLGG
jgi:murein DD-endopeptidase MepM/ murein hydrolase activator NlpD